MFGRNRRLNAWEKMQASYLAQKIEQTSSLLNPCAEISQDSTNVSIENGESIEEPDSGNMFNAAIEIWKSINGLIAPETCVQLVLPESDIATKFDDGDFVVNITGKSATRLGKIFSHSEHYRFIVSDSGIARTQIVISKDNTFYEMSNAMLSSCPTPTGELAKIYAFCQRYDLVEKRNRVKSNVERVNRKTERCDYCGCLICEPNTHCQSCGAPV